MLGISIHDIDLARINRYILNDSNFYESLIILCFFFNFLCIFFFPFLKLKKLINL